MEKHIFSSGDTLYASDLNDLQDNIINEFISLDDISGAAEGKEITITDGSESVIKNINITAINTFDKTDASPDNIKVFPSSVTFTVKNNDDTTDTGTEYTTPFEIYSGKAETDVYANYTDTDGNKYVSDIVDLEAGTITHYIRKLVLNSSLNFSMNHIGVFQLGSQPETPYENASSTVEGGLIGCTHYPKGKNYYNATQYTALDNGELPSLGIGVGGKNIRITDTRFTTAADFKAYYVEQYKNGTPIIVYYLLKTPIVEELDNSDIKYLKAITLYKNTTITSDSYIKCEYWKDFTHKKYIDSVGGGSGDVDSGTIGFITPEMQFGAKGDGETDDTEAINNALSYAIENKTPLKMSGTYKITSTLKISCSDMFIEINSIDYKGSDVAIQFEGLRNHINVRNITSNGSGFRIYANTTHTLYNTIELGAITAAKNAFENVVVGKSSYTNKISFNYLKAGGADYCGIKEMRAEGGTGFLSETTYTGGEIEKAGWACHLIGSDFKLLNVHFENDNNAIKLESSSLITGYIYGCRMAELQNRFNDVNGENEEYDSVKGAGPYNADTGTVIKFIGRFQNIMADFANWVGYSAIDVSEMIPYNNENVIQPSGACVIRAQIKPGIVLGTDGETYKYYNQIGDEMLVCDGYKFVNGGFGGSVVVSDDYTGLSEQNPNDIIYFPDYFVIDAEKDVAIKLNNPSYSPYGVKEITVDQSKNNKATITDYFGNVIFDGTNYDNGVYKLVCREITQYATFNITNTNEQFKWFIESTGGSGVNESSYLGGES